VLWSGGFRLGRNPAVDGAEGGDGGRFFMGTCGIEGDDSRQDDEPAALGGLDRNDDVAAAEQIDKGDAFESEGDGVDDQGGGGE
jgi:hypothetical protein